MGKYLTLFDTHSSYEEYIDGPDAILPNVSYCKDEGNVHFNPYVHDYSKDYLTTVARENGTISFNIWKNMGTDYITSISYSTDGGETWVTTQNQNDKSENLVIDVNVNEDDRVLWKGTAQQTGYYDGDDYADYVGSFFSSTAEFDVEGNIMSLLYGDNFIGEVELEYSGQFACLFRDYDEEKECFVVSAENLVLPATILAEGCYRFMFQSCTNLTTAPELNAITLAEGCYGYMFADCTSLTTAPELPATTLADSCYEGMFLNCASLTTAPALPATTLTSGCYQYMFKGCTSLATAPELPATTLASGCYSTMFRGCTSLTTAPALPATTLTARCYNYMFQDCTSLTAAPELPATTLVDYCYMRMFRNCTSLNYIKCLATDISASSCTYDWVQSVASSGTFVKPSTTDWSSKTGNDGIPTNWTVQDAS